MMRIVAGPAIAVAPGLQVLADTLNNPAMKQMPNQMAQMNDVLAEVTARLAPLGQLAESAGGLFGGLRFPGFGGGSKPAASGSAVHSDDEHETASTPSPVTTAAAPKKSAAVPKKTAARKTATRKKTAARKKPAVE